jgi:sulfotransferase
MKEMIEQIIREEMSRNQKTYYFIAGLPRSGSSLLSAILNQNPRFYSGPSSPVLGLMSNIERSLASDELFLAYPKPQQAAELITNTIRHYYSDVEKPVIFDKNRGWPSFIHYIEGYFGVEKPKILCPVRNLDEVLASFIAMHRRNPFHIDGKINFIDEMLVKSNLPLTDGARCELLAGPNGILGQSFDSIKKAMMEGREASLYFIEYSDLTNNPEETMKGIYAFLGETPFKHDFSNITKSYEENDKGVYGFSDMHQVSSTLKQRLISPSEFLPENVIESCRGQEFWRMKLDVSDESSVNATATFFSEPLANDSVIEDEDTTETKLIGVN